LPGKFFAVRGPYRILFVVKGVNLALLHVKTQTSDHEVKYDLRLILTSML